MTEIKKILSSILFLLLLLITSKSYSFTITAEPPDKFSKLIFGTTGWSIFIDGDIDKVSATELARVLPKYYKTGVFIYFNSNGGDPLAAMEIGKIIRKFNGANVSIGKKNYITNEVNSGICLSACTLAFLGGTYRFIDKNSVYGVHLAKLKNEIDFKKYDFALGQILSSKIAIYLDEMGVNQDLMKYITSSSDINIIPEEILKQLNVINNGKFKSVWEIKQIDDTSVFYLVGTQSSDRGEGKLIFMCQKSQITLTTAYSYDKTFQNEKDGYYQVHSLYLDNQMFYLNSPNHVEITNFTLFNTFINLDKELAKKIALSGSTIYQMQHSRESPLFVGFEININEKDRTKILNFINGCK